MLKIFCHIPWGILNTQSCLSINRFNEWCIRQSSITIRGSTGSLKRCGASPFLMYTCTSTNRITTSQYCSISHPIPEGVYGPLYGVVSSLALLLPARLTCFCRQVFLLAKPNCPSAPSYSQWAIITWIFPSFHPFVSRCYSHTFFISSLSNPSLCIFSIYIYKNLCFASLPVIPFVHFFICLHPIFRQHTINCTST